MGKTRSPFGVNLRKIREEFGIEPSRLSEGLNLGEFGRQTISNWENGHREPNLQMLCQIADFFGITTDLLLGREKKENAIVRAKIDSLIIDNLEDLSTEDQNKLFSIINVFLAR